jgi:putative ABC transport system permease protein
MLINEILQVAIAAIWANKLRSFLTMLGIIIGIAAVITMVSLGEGAQRRVQTQLQSLGTNILTVRPGQQFYGGLDRGDNSMTAKQAEALRVDPNYISAVSPEMSRRQQVTYGRGNSNNQITGVWPEYFGLQNYKVAKGRIFTDGEERGRRRVAVIGPAVGDRLNINTNLLLGKQIEIRGVPFDSIGILESRGDQGFMNPDETIYIPLATAQFRVFGTERVSSIYVQARDEKSMDPAVAEIDRKLRREMRVKPGAATPFTVRNQTSLLETFQSTAATFTYLLAGIALVSLLVGGIGIMNIMLVSVTERTREIGIRKALGAKPRHILLQFLIEALVLCLCGGILGILLGAGAAILLSRLAQWNTLISPTAIIVAFAFSALVGLFFGIWPARRAARLDPIVALRYE